MTRSNPTLFLLPAIVVALSACGDIDSASDTGALSDTDASRDVALDAGDTDSELADVPDTVNPGADSTSDSTGETGDADGGAADANPAVDVSEPDAGPGEDATAACRPVFTQGTYVGIGFPRAAERLHTTGTIVATVLFAQFTDVAADRTPQDVMDILSPDAEDFYQTVSYGQTNLEFRPHLQWLDMSGNAARYAAALTDFYLHRDFILEAVELADADVDFSDTDIIVVMSTPNAAEIEFGPTWMGDFNAPIVADGRTITNGVTSGADLLY
jgi:hypothetical protein